MGVKAATAIGVPLYWGIATFIPVISALAEKGMRIGTLLAFAMSVTARDSFRSRKNPTSF
jgi:uncharacterized membrane protein YraQ (UPF0718 family)